jgi:hypothetical protein
MLKSESTEGIGFVFAVPSGTFQVANAASCERTNVGARKIRAENRTKIGGRMAMVGEDEGYYGA